MNPRFLYLQYKNLRAPNMKKIFPWKLKGVRTAFLPMAIWQWLMRLRACICRCRIWKSRCLSIRHRQCATPISWRKMKIWMKSECSLPIVTWRPNRWCGFGRHFHELRLCSGFGIWWMNMKNGRFISMTGKSREMHPLRNLPFRFPIVRDRKNWRRWFIIRWKKESGCLLKHRRG